MGLKMNLPQFQSASKMQLLEIRAQDRIIQSAAFEEAWKGAPAEKRRQIESIIKHPDTEYLKKWIKDVSPDGFGVLTIKQLRTLASYYHISAYSRLSKEKLVEALKNAAKKTTRRDAAVALSSKSHS